MSALAQTTDDVLVSQPDHGTIFLSRRRNLRMVKTPRYPIMGPAGQKVGEQAGQTVAFGEGRFFCPAEGQVTLEDGRQIDAQELRAWLLGGEYDGVRYPQHRLLGDVEEGFWAVETTAPPVSTDELARLNRAAVQHDVETIERMIAQEREGWGREDFIGGMQQTIGEIEDVQARVRAEIEAEQKAAAKPARGAAK